MFWARYYSSCTLRSFFSILENKLIVYADNSTLMAIVPSPGVRVAVAESLIRDLGMVSEWCDLWGIKFNASKTKTMVVSRSRTLKESNDLIILGVTIDSKMTLSSSLSFQSSFAKTWYLEEVLASVS